MGKKVQSLLSHTNITCKVCGMAYYPHVAADKSAHSRYHEGFENGPPWTTTDSPILTERVQGAEVALYAVDRTSARQVARVEALLEMANRELNAPEAGSSWKEQRNTPVPGRAYVAVVQDRAVGVCVTEPVAEARWMVHTTQEIVPGQINRNVRVGISRIWVAPKWRRYGLALRMLDAVLDNAIYGMRLDRNLVGFSQPSHAGGLLAKRFNGVVHKSGHTLVPVYIEED